MAKSTKDSRNNVSLEELLRFKRAERPDEVFWEQFDSELHQRMMQTLVKKDPWPVQVLRGLSGKMAQTTAIAAAAAVLALMVIQPTFLATGEQNQLTVASVETSEMLEAAPAEIDSSLDSSRDSSLLAEADYEIEVLSVADSDIDAAVTHDFGLDDIEAASYDLAAYSADMPLPGFTSTGVASLVY